MIYRQSNNWNVKFSIIYLKCCSSCLCCCHWIISAHFRSYEYIQDIIHPFAHDKSSSISQIINGKSRNLQKLLKYFIGKTTSVFNILFDLVCSLLILSYIQKIYLLLFYFYLSYYHNHYFQ